MNTFLILVDHQKCIVPNYMRTKKIGSFCGSPFHFCCVSFLFIISDPTFVIEIK